MKIGNKIEIEHTVQDGFVVHPSSATYMWEGEMVQHVDVEYVDTKERLQRIRFVENGHPRFLEDIHHKLAFIVECHLTDTDADFSKPITITYTPLNNQSE